MRPAAVDGYRQSVQKALLAISNESVSEYLAQVALQSYPEYLEIFYAAMQFSMQLCVGL